MTPEEKWQRLSNPKTLEDYGSGLTFDEMLQIPGMAECAERIIARVGNWYEAEFTTA